MSDHDVPSAHEEQHFANRVGWLRAAVLGANDGLLSTASIIVGVAAAASSSGQILTAGLAGLAAGAFSMAAGEYVSVSSQADSEAADLARESAELEKNPDRELAELTAILRTRGLSEKTARQAAKEMTQSDALASHAREEIGLSDEMSARPFQAAFASAIAFISGGLPPLLAAIVAPQGWILPVVAVVALVILLGLGALGARRGGAPVVKASLRVAFWGIVAMGATYLVGAVFGTYV
ncbi:VIT family protein [Fulvimarina sp. MAC3]|uniref:VIT1/CCC1 transporter family protein n=1 Tax=Fulvimarina sp. MAC3 TaxID=3148887 RepID=UPI0031FC7714